MKNITDTLTPLMDKFRAKTGLTDKLTIARATGLIDHFDLHVNPNLLPKTEYIADPNGWTGNPRYMLLDVFGKALEPNTTYTISFNSKVSDNKTHILRYRLFDFVKNNDSSVTRGDQANFESGRRQVITFTTDNSNNERILLYPSSSSETPSWITTFYDCKLELGDLATPLTK